MSKKKLLLFCLLSLAITFMSPFIFYSYFEKKPEDLNQRILFGGPFPFAEQAVSLPVEKDKYPIEVKFISPLDKETSFKITPFILSFSSIFLFLFAFYTIISRFINGRQLKEPH